MLTRLVTSVPAADFAGRSMGALDNGPLNRMVRMRRDTRWRQDNANRDVLFSAK